ncbi:hypothetical protein NMY22_g8148 [Coprinellus aureogranulatus]|nr:hypothetical protein NMY22_g8148 [Coprinellus aureogranulatus]
MDLEGDDHTAVGAAMDLTGEGSVPFHQESVALLADQLQKMREEFLAREAQAAQREKMLCKQIESLQHALAAVQSGHVSRTPLPTTEEPEPATQIPVPMVLEPEQQADQRNAEERDDVPATPPPPKPERSPSVVPVSHPLTPTPQPPRSKGKRKASTTPSPTRKLKRYQLNLADMDPDVEILKNALHLHICLLSGWGDTAPTDVDPIIVARFKNHFPSEATFPDKHKGPYLIPISTVELQPYAPVRTRCRTRSQVSQVEQFIVEFIRAMLARFGLPRWGPDFRETSYAAFNASNRIIALDTFRQAVQAGAYAFVNVKRSAATEMSTLISLYDHIVHHHFHQQYLAEKRRAGSVAEKKIFSAMYIARKRLSEKRETWVVENGFGPCYADYISPKATSDDERDPDGGQVNERPIHWIKQREERSAEAEAMIRALEAQMDAEAGRVSRVRPEARRDKIRKVPPKPLPSRFPALPKGMPIDYYDPHFYNGLPPRLRSTMADGSGSVGLLPLQDSKLYFTECPDELLSRDEFQQKYGESVLAKYKSAPVLLKERGYEGDEDDDMFDDDDNEEEDNKEEEGANSGKNVTLLEDVDEDMSELGEEEEAEYIASRRPRQADNAEEEEDI